MTPRQHLDLLLRFGRTFNLRKAVELATTPGCTVLDAGCGLGLLSLWALKQGACRVTGIDIDGVNVNLARRMAEENGCAECCEFRSEDLWTAAPTSDDDRVDVLIAMLYLNDPRRDESQVKLSGHVRAQWLRPGGRMIPERVQYTVEALAWDAQDYPTIARTEESRVALIEDQYDLNFSALKDFLGQTIPLHAFPLRRGDGTIDRQGSRTISETVDFCNIEYRSPGSEYPGAIRLPVTGTGIATSLLWTQSLYFEDLLLFRNESISWISKPMLFSPGDVLVADIDNGWREKNCVTVEKQTV